MFTGIVEEIGVVVEATVDATRDNALRIGCRTVIADAKLGDSIAVNGVCLTVTALTQDSFTVGLSPETLRRTNLENLQLGSPVNLERSLRAGDRMGGHYVQGHVDGTGVITSVVPDGESLRITVQPPAGLLPYIVMKGYIAVDGVSLTVAERRSDDFVIALVAYTQDAVIMGRQQPGTRVNLEVDILAKYVENVLLYRDGDSYAARTH
ncbi:MAG TPA: riboflavin synthase [Herpetosiphonaceae bacterium]|nr:riboflavin synthase [Herpetosiphonaceae bacterium]